MNIEQLKDFALETSSIARRIYGMKLILRGGQSDAARWFLFNREKLKYEMNFKSNGLILDIGSYVGEYTKKLLDKNPKMTFWLYEPIPEYYRACLVRFKDRENVSVYQKAVSADGRDIRMQIDGLRSRQELKTNDEVLEFASINIQEIFDSVSEIELLKMNIEGMEYECLNQLILSNSLIKANYLLIQFHNFESEAEKKRNLVIKAIEEDFTNVFTFEWIWELWIRKGK